MRVLFRIGFRLLTLPVYFSGQASLEGQTAVAVELEKMNVLVAGIENPISVVVSDVPDSCLCLQPSGGKLLKYGAAKYGWLVNSDTTIATLSILDSCKNEPIGKRSFRVKIVSVEMCLNGRPNRGSNMEAAEFKAQSGIAALVSGYDINGRCLVVGFTAEFYSKKTGELWVGYNPGARFSGEVLKKQQAVQPGDWVVFRQMSYQCPGMSRPGFSADELVFRIE